MIPVPGLSRPSTSPVPNFFADIRKAAHSKLLAQQQSRLRPLPARGGVLVNMMIEGNKTGEEKPVAAIERRESVQNKSPPPPAAKPERDHRELQQLLKEQQRIRKLEGELKRAQELLRHANLDNEALKDKESNLQGLLDAANQRAQQEQKENHAQMSMKNKENEELKKIVAGLTKELQQSRDANMAQVTGQQSEVTQLRQEMASLRSQLDSTHSSGQSKANNLQKELERYRALSEELHGKLSRATTEIEGHKSEINSMQKERKLAEARLEDLLKAARDDATRKESALNEWKHQIDMCNRYIIKICQPQFSVVKDESLTPATTSDTDSGGYVLVPLQLMLEGYGILPPEMKKNIADEYEKTKAAGKGGSHVPYQAPTPDDDDELDKLEIGGGPAPPTAPKRPKGTYTLGRSTRTA